MILICQRRYHPQNFRILRCEHTQDLHKFLELLPFFQLEMPLLIWTFRQFQTWLSPTMRTWFSKYGQPLWKYSYWLLRILRQQI